MTTGWKGYKLPPNWRQIIEQEVVAFDKKWSRIISQEGSNLDEQERIQLKVMVDEIIDDLRSQYLN